jgi:hypothetical protein
MTQEQFPFEQAYDSNKNILSFVVVSLFFISTLTFIIFNKIKRNNENETY